MTFFKMTADEKAKIRWACRRGMLELDILLIQFFDHQFEQLSFSEQQQFKKFLSIEDPQLMNCLIGGATQSIPKEFQDATRRSCCAEECTKQSMSSEANEHRNLKGDEYSLLFSQFSELILKIKKISNS